MPTKLGLQMKTVEPGQGKKGNLKSAYPTYPDRKKAIAFSGQRVPTAHFILAFATSCL